MKGSTVIQNILMRSGPVPSPSESEVVTIALHQELIGEPREDLFFHLYQEQLRSYFPGLNGRSRYNRRKRHLWPVTLAVWMSLQKVVLDAGLLEGTTVIDSVPVPCVKYKRDKQASDIGGLADYGVCSSTAMKYFGFKLHTIASSTGVLVGFVLTPANRYDNRPVIELFDSCSHHIKRLIGDKTHNDAALQEFLARYRSLQLLVPTWLNQTPWRSGQAQKQLNRVRLIRESDQRKSLFSGKDMR